MQAKKTKENKPRAKTVGKVKGKGKVEELMEEVMVAAKIYGFTPISNKRLGGAGKDINIMVVT